MSKRNTVRINMEMLDGYLKAKNITPKAFCETQLGFSDGWYYSIRKNGGRGVKVLSAQLIARITGIDYKTLVIDEKDVVKKETINAKLDAGREYGNPSITTGASPRPTERTEELQNEDVRKEREELFEDIDRLIMEKSRLVGQVETKKNELRKIIEAAEKESNGSIIPVHINDFIHILETAFSNQIVKNEMNNDKLFGYVDCFITLRYLANKRKEKAKNARPDED